MIAAGTAAGNYETLLNGLNDGLDAGPTVNYLKEILVQRYAYGDFPRGLRALDTFMKVLDAGKASGIADKEDPKPHSGKKYARNNRPAQRNGGRAESMLSPLR